MPQAVIKINGVAGSNDSLPINTLVQLDNQDVGGELTYLWAILSQPDGVADALSSLVIKTPTFTPKKEGTYLLQLTVNQALPTQQIGTAIAAVRQLKTGIRIPSPGETIEANSVTPANTQGWARAVNAVLLQVDGLISDPGLIVGVNTSGGVLTHGDVVRVTSGAVIKSGLPGQETVPGFTKAPATALGNVDELLSVVEGDIAGNANVPAGDLAKVRYIGRVATIPIGAGVVGDPVYVSDTATLSATQGTIRRQVGSIMSASGGNRDVWFDGAGGVDVTPIDRAYMLYGAPSTGMLNAHRIDGNNASPGAIGGVPYVFRAGDVSTMPFAVGRFSNVALSDLQQWRTELGVALARVMSDGTLRLDSQVPTAAQDAATKTYVDQRATTGNILLNGGFDFAQRRLGTAPPYGLAYINARLYQVDRWAVWSNAVGESGTIATSAPSALFGGSGSIGITRNPGNPAGNTIYLAQEIARASVVEMVGNVHRLTVRVWWSALATAATVTMRLLTGTGATTEVANPTYPTGNVVVGTTSIVVSGTGSQQISLPLPSTIGAGVRNACVQLLIQPTTVPGGGGESWLVSTAMLHRSYDACTYDQPWRRMHADLRNELDACCHYCEASSQNMVGALPWSMEAYTAYVGPVNPVPNGGTIWLGLHPRFRVPKRTSAPTIVFLNPATGAAGTWAFSALGASAVAAANIGNMGFTVVNNTGSNQNYVSQFVTGHWLALAEI